MIAIVECRCSFRSYRKWLRRELNVPAIFHQAFPDLSVKDVDDFVAEADKDGNGTLTREEFLQFCTVSCSNVLNNMMLKIGSLMPCRRENSFMCP